MATEIFTLLEFGAALQAACSPHNLFAVGLEPMGYEAWFAIDVKRFSNGSAVQIRVNSSVDVRTKRADGAGENSIRAWLTDTDGEPLGNKTQRWVTRQPGWQNRMADMIDKLVVMATSINFCHTCHSIEKVFVVKKEGANKGRLFKKCDCQNSFTWLDEYEQAEDVQEVPSCPKCGSRMVLRTGRNGQFWGCSTYPTCRGSLNVGQETQTPAERHDISIKRAELVQEVRQARGEAKPKEYIPSHYQQAIFKHMDGWYDTEFADVFVRDHGNVLVIKALAGSGKTTTGKQMAKRLPHDQKGRAVAFNKPIAQELQKVMPRNVMATTNHSMGYKACRTALKLGENAVYDGKVRMILDTYMDLREYGHLVSAISDLVSFVKATLSDAEDANLDSLSAFYGVELNGDRDFVYDAVRYVLRRCLEMTTVIDYDDMIWLPIMLNLPCEKFDFIFVDEAQDLNAADLELISRHMHAGTKAVFVGDEFQSMYGFRGADVDSIDKIIQRFDVTTLPLSITYRNPKCVVRLVNDKFPEIGLEAAEWAEEGEIRDMVMHQMMEAVQPGDMVLCRTNAPLVKPCFALIRSGVKATIRGRNIGDGLISLIHKMKAADILELMFKLGEYRDREVAKLVEAKKGSAAEALQDKVDTIIAIADGCETVACIEDKINRMFGDKVEGVVFSSVHRAKGLEADNVFILKPGLMPHPMARQDWERQQERNIEYVAITRCKRTLTYVID